MSYDPKEHEEIHRIFGDMLAGCTKDGGQKRQRGEKVPWWRDETHEAAIFSHLNKWKHGEKADKDSGAHPLVHLAWRALALAYQETQGQLPPGQIEQIRLHACCDHDRGIRYCELRPAVKSWTNGIDLGAYRNENLSRLAYEYEAKKEPRYKTAAEHMGDVCSEPECPVCDRDAAYWNRVTEQVQDAARQLDKVRGRG